MSMPRATLAPSFNSISGRATCNSASASTPTVPPAPIKPALLSATFVAWLLPSMTSACVMLGSAEAMFSV